MKKFGMVAVALLVLVAASSAQAGVGGTLEYNGSVDQRIGINFSSAGGSTIDILGGFMVPDGGTNVIALGGRFEKAMTGGGNAMPVLGVLADVYLGSPDVGDSWTDFSVGGFLGGKVEIVEDFSIVARMGVAVDIVGARAANFDSSTNFGTFANFVIRVTNLWGGK